MKKCLEEVKPTCDQDQRLAIGHNVVSVMEGIVGSEWCGLELWNFMCEWTQVDPMTVCDADAAIACGLEKDTVAGNPFASDTMKCQ